MNSNAALPSCVSPANYSHALHGCEVYIDVLVLKELHVWDKHWLGRAIRLSPPGAAFGGAVVRKRVSVVENVHVYT